MGLIFPGWSPVLPSGGTSLPTASGGLLAARPEASAAVVGQTYLATDAGPAGTLYACITDGAGAFDWAPIYLADDSDAEGTATVADGAGGLQKTSADVSGFLAAADAAAMRAILALPPLLLTSANATVTDASPAGDGSAAIDGDGVITLSAEDALAGGFAAGPKISLPLSGDAGTRFRARVRLISKSGPSSDSLLALYFVGAAGLAIYARISGQIGVWDLGASVLATASVSALWDGSEYLEIRMVDGYLSFGVWQGTTYTPLYLTTTTVRPTSVGVMFGHVAGGATQTVTLDGFTVTDLRAW